MLPVQAVHVIASVVQFRQLGEQGEHKLEESG